MKKKRILTFLLAFVLVFPVLFLAGCKDDGDKDKDKDKKPKATIESVSVELAGDDYVLEEDTITLTYNNTLVSIADTDFVVKLVYDDDTTKTIAKETAEVSGYTYSSTLPTEGVTKAGSYTLTFTYGEFSATINVVVEKAEIDLANAKWNYTSAYSYSGAAQTVALTGLPEGVTATYTGEGSTVSATNIGTYKAIAVLSYDSENYVLKNTPALTLNWEIKKAEINLNAARWNYTAPLVYTGAAQTVSITGLPATVTASYNNASATVVGEYQAVATLNYDASKYIIKNAPALTLDWKIKKAQYDMSEVDWNYSGDLVYTGLPQEIALINLPDGVDVVEYDGNAGLNAGKYNASVELTQADTTNYELVDSSAFDIEWEIKKATYDLTGVQWKFAAMNDPQNFSDYVAPFEFVEDSGGYYVQVTGLPAGVTVVSYVDERAYSAGVYTSHAILTQADSANYEAVPEYITLKWQLTVETCVSSIKLNDIDKDQAWLEALEWIPVGAKLEITPATGYVVSISGPVGPVSKIESAQLDEDYEIRITSESDPGNTLISRYVRVRYFNGFMVNGVSVSGSELYELPELGVNTVEIDLGEDPFTNKTLFELYEGRLFYRINSEEWVEITANKFTVELPDRDVYLYIRVYTEDMQNNDDDSVYIVPYSYMESVSIKDKNGSDNEVYYTNASLWETFIDEIQVELKEEYSSYTVQIKDKNGNAVTADTFKNVTNFETYIITILDDEEQVVEIREIYVHFSFNESVFNNNEYILTQEETLAMDGGWTLDDEITLTLSDGVSAHTLKYTEDGYTYSQDVIVNKSAMASDYLTNFKLLFEDEYSTNYMDVDVDENMSWNTLTLQYWKLLNSDSFIIEPADGISVVNTSFVRNGDIHTVTVTVTDGASPEVTLYFYLYSNIIYDGDASISSTAYKTDNYMGDMTDIREIELDAEGTVITLTDMSATAMVVLSANNENARMEAYNGEILIDSSYGSIWAIFSKAGTYTLKVISSDETTTVTYTVIVEGEFLPVLEVTYGQTSLMLEMDDYGMPSGTLEAFYGLDESFFPTNVATAINTIGVDYADLMGAFGYIPEAASVTGNTLTISIISMYASHGAYDIMGNPIEDLANAELTIYTDAVYGKYVAFFGSFGDGPAPVVLYLSQKTYPVSITLGTGDDAQTFNYQFDMNIAEETGNLHYGDFAMQGMSGMVAVGEALSVDLSTMTKIEVTLNFGTYYADLSYSVIALDAEGEQAIYTPTANTLTQTAYFEVTSDAEYYYLTCYVAFRGATIETLESSALPVIIVIEK